MELLTIWWGSANVNRQNYVVFKNFIIFHAFWWKDYKIGDKNNLVLFSLDKILKPAFELYVSEQWFGSWLV